MLKTGYKVIIPWCYNEKDGMKGPKKALSHKVQSGGAKGQTSNKAKAKSTDTSSTCSWTRLGVRVSSAESKELFLTHLRHSLLSGCQLGRDFVAGTNGVSKLLELRNAAVLCVARDAPPCLHNHLVDAAHLRGVPVVVLPKLMLPLGAALGIKRAAAFAVPLATLTAAAGKMARAQVAVPQAEGEEESEQERKSRLVHEAAAKDASRDNVLECLLQMSATSA